MNPNQAMADSLGEQLSALMDGELPRDQVRFLLRGVAAQSDLAQRWSSYHVISACLRREYVAVALPADFADGVI
ncbi:sigma-E factor negative regulatory protein, partial [Rudaea sp.]|uniref:sigma-E factor negative regulatory protein n=1 Tax=Rudaea sp. TaxID=2136325 RepID=UPI002ED2323B